MKKFTFVSVLLIAAMMVALVGCTPENDIEGETNAEVTGDPIKIGVIQPLSGDVAFDGQNAVRGAQLAAKQINEAGGILGRPVELIVEDGAADPAQSVAAAEKLITRDNVCTILGAFTSSATGAVIPVAEDNGIPFVTGIATSPTLTRQGAEYFFRAVGTSELFVGAFAKAILEETDINKVAYLVVNDDWGRGSMEAFSKAVEENGGENSVQLIFNRGEPDLYNYLTQIKDANPDAIYAVANTANAARITQQARELGITADLIGEGGWTSNTFIELAGEYAEGVYGLVEYLPGVDTPVNNQFTEAYMEEYGELPDKYAASLYTTANIAFEAIERAGTDEPEAIRDALKDTDYEGVAGNYKFDKVGQGYGFNMFMAQIMDGVPEFVLQAEVQPQELD